MLAGLRTLETLPHVGDVRGKGFLCGVELVEDKGTKKAFDASRNVGGRLLKECQARGLVSRVRGEIFCLAPPFVTTDEQIDRIVSILGDSIVAATGAA